jgi:hypothetical protein
MKEFTCQEAAAEIQRIYETLKLSCNVVSLGWKTEKSETQGGKPWEHYAFRYEFSGALTNAAFSWKQGLGCKTKAPPAEVLASVCREWADADATTFEDWAGNFGYEEDSRRAEAIYKSCLSHGLVLDNLGVNTATRVAFADAACQL